MNGRHIDPAAKARAAYWALVFVAAALLAPCRASCSVLEKQLNLEDVSGNASPLGVSGQVIFRCDDSSHLPFSYKIRFAAKNVSGKGVLIFVLHLEVNGLGGPGHDEKYLHEYFFDDVFVPSASDVYDSRGNSFGQSVNDVPMTCAQAEPHPVARVRVEFVQFSDGLTWGDLDSARDGLAARQDAVRELDSLELTYEQAGEDAFLAQCAAKQNFNVHSLDASCQSDRNRSECLYQALRKKIISAKTHQAGIDSATAQSVPAQ
jgi:hypothetical protein